MISDKLNQAFNDQIGSELYSAHLYLSMAAYFESINLPGFANWMRIQHQEETIHALKLFDYVNQRNGRVVLNAIDQPRVDFESVRAAVMTALDHERSVSSLINSLYEVSSKEKDYAAEVLLEWFINEQVEEEKSVTDIVDQLDLIGDNGTGLMILDDKLASRVLVSANGGQPV
tara:strand:- start:3203 stop:3721 length:519 start_codon:yes stop_codon:yes gene_type:complete